MIRRVVVLLVVLGVLVVGAQQVMAQSVSVRFSDLPIAVDEFLGRSLTVGVGSSVTGHFYDVHVLWCDGELYSARFEGDSGETMVPVGIVVGACETGQYSVAARIYRVDQPFAVVGSVSRQFRVGEPAAIVQESVMVLGQTQGPFQLDPWFDVPFSSLADAISIDRGGFQGIFAITVMILCFGLGRWVTRSDGVGLVCAVASFIVVGSRGYSRLRS